MLKRKKSKNYFKSAKQFLVGGVNSPVRAFKSVGGVPLFIKEGKGDLIWDEDENCYIDFVSSWGPLILGHAHPQVLQRVKKRMAHGFSFGASTQIEIKMAQTLVHAIPSIEKVRFVSSGTEAVMSALRLARAYTNRDKILKFSGCYHGHSDGLLVKAGSGALTLGIPDSLGVPESYSKQTLVLPYNDLDSVRDLFVKQGNEIAAVIVEPIAANMGVVLPKQGFLQGLREITAQSKALLIFDEVITGFRIAYGGAQTYFNVQPDITCFGKIIGGGFPVGAFAGKKEILSLVAPDGPVYQAGTLSGNPVAMEAGLATLEILKKMNPYANFNKKSEEFVHSIKKEVEWLNFVSINAIGSIFTIFFTPRPVTDYDSAKTSNTKAYAKFFQFLLEEGIYFPPSQFEAVFLSLAHKELNLSKAKKAIVNAIFKTERIFHA
ncbi:MAG: glutamate-1-semialdehyde-2,1-aminomutase [Elusimicrobia bacterium RIFCSPLOWO2_02_FULL_39_32]|nr:MAG: glutamate-1-semialdehyde-2,1-aminomutase [Elusimicrobia bacterium GWA2_38_7]OGR80086.1 MAG: glutamate-1-semialdehyde-2,1-aminomutase [Elusimicrobia bacterium RIFCSPHIGHO2_02_FULL_39_36]OGR91119.1 MAG: glutamate-1-semialdehyde-2,1-aminomutase [Elusimicrobia bacterium RIFCSPLOWO2_02_FULL_39_32]OGS00086.1 MAG: glutamate-1-semialdehyde-2,1-aminomutase [Elusimicrobia bacterium RIFCSPLOWO2_12_FULL_39_28]